MLSGATYISGEAINKSKLMMNTKYRVVFTSEKGRYLKIFSNVLI